MKVLILLMASGQDELFTAGDGVGRSITMARVEWHPQKRMFGTALEVYMQQK